VATQRQDTAVESVRHLTSQRHPDCRSACGRIGLREWAPGPNRCVTAQPVSTRRPVPVAAAKALVGNPRRHRTALPNGSTESRADTGLGQPRTASTCRPPAALARRDSRLGVRRSVPPARSYERATGPGSTCSGYCEVRQTPRVCSSATFRVICAWPPRRRVRTVRARWCRDRSLALWFGVRAAPSGGGASKEGTTTDAGFAIIGCYASSQCHLGEPTAARSTSCDRSLCGRRHCARRCRTGRG